jgi:hypothetical protein
MRPCASRSAIHVASLTSVLRPGTFLMCIAFASTSSKLPSSTCHTGFQYTPVASMATWVTPCSVSHSDNAMSSFVVAPNVRTSCATEPSATTRAHATTVSHRDEHPDLHISNEELPRSPPRGSAGAEPTSSNSRTRAPALAGVAAVWGARGAPGPTDLRARCTKNSPTSSPARRLCYASFIPMRVGTR